jgi:hypothetical protein
MSDGNLPGVRVDFNEPLITSSSTAGAIHSFRDIPNIQTMAVEPIQFLVDQMISRKSMTLWTGPDGTAKTFILQKLAISVASGQSFLGRRCQQAPVLILDYENPSHAVKDRLQLMTDGMITDLKIWGTWLEQQPPQIGSDVLFEIARQEKPLIIVDPFRNSHSSDENSSTEMSMVMQMLRASVREGAAVIIVHHPAKTEGSSGRGSSAIKASCDAAFLQEMSETGLITLSCIKNRFGEKYKVTIRPNYDEGTFEVVNSPEFQKHAADLETVQKIMQENPGLSQNGIRKLANMNTSKLGRLLREQTGKLWTTAGGPKNATLFYPIPAVVLDSQKNSEQLNSSSPKTSCSVVLPFRGEKQQNSRDQNSKPENNSEQQEQNGRPEERTLPSCEVCGSYAVVRMSDGSLECQTCSEP